MRDPAQPFAKAEELVDRVMDICPFPATAQRLMALVHDESASLEAIGAAVACDPALATQVLRVANSAAFRKAGSDAIRDLRQALVLLGLEELRAMAGAMALLATFATPDEVSLDLQRASAVSGSIAAAMAPRFAGAGRSLPFLCGLLCEVGALACLVVDGPAYVELWKRTAGAPQMTPLDAAKTREQMELQRYRASTRAIGARLLRRHRLPEDIAAAVEAPPGQPPESPLIHRATAFARMATPLVTASTAEGELEAGLADIARSVSIDADDPTDLAHRVRAAAAHAEHALRSARR